MNHHSTPHPTSKALTIVVLETNYTFNISVHRKGKHWEVTVYSTEGLHNGSEDLNVHKRTLGLEFGSL